MVGEEFFRVRPSDQLETDDGPFSVSLHVNKPRAKSERNDWYLLWRMICVIYLYIYTCPSESDSKLNCFDFTTANSSGLKADILGMSFVDNMFNKMLL